MLEPYHLLDTIQNRQHAEVIDSLIDTLRPTARAHGARKWLRREKMVSFSIAFFIVLVLHFLLFKSQRYGLNFDKSDLLIYLSIISISILGVPVISFALRSVFVASRNSNIDILNGYVLAADIAIGTEMGKQAFQEYKDNGGLGRHAEKPKRETFETSNSPIPNDINRNSSLAIQLFKFTTNYQNKNDGGIEIIINEIIKRNSPSNQLALNAMEDFLSIANKENQPKEISEPNYKLIRSALNIYLSEKTTQPINKYENLDRKRPIKPPRF